MAEEVSLSVLASRLEAEVRSNLRKIEMDELDRHTRIMISSLQQAFIDARKYISLYSQSETREEQISGSKKAKKWLVEIRKLIVLLSERDIFGAADVAQLSAQTEQIIEELN